MVELKKGQKCYVTIDPNTHQGKQCKEYIENFQDIIVDREVDTSENNTYIREAVIEKVGKKFYTIKYRRNPESIDWVRNVMINKEYPFYEKEKQFCCLSESYEEASKKLVDFKK